MQSNGTHSKKNRLTLPPRLESDFSCKAQMPHRRTHGAFVLRTGAAGLGNQLNILWHVLEVAILLNRSLYVEHGNGPLKYITPPRSVVGGWEANLSSLESQHGSLTPARKVAYTTIMPAARRAAAANVIANELHQVKVVEITNFTAAQVGSLEAESVESSGTILRSSRSNNAVNTIE
eukprot:6177083-Pleurochrysis_carterae.AAC.4